MERLGHVKDTCAMLGPKHFNVLHARDFFIFESDVPISMKFAGFVDCQLASQIVPILPKLPKIAPNVWPRKCFRRAPKQSETDPKQSEMALEQSETQSDGFLWSLNNTSANKLLRAPKQSETDPEQSETAPQQSKTPDLKPPRQRKQTSF